MPTLLERTANNIIEVFADESCQTQARYLVIGGLACHIDSRERIEAAFQAVRASHAVHNEVKWNKVGTRVLPFYVDMIDTLAGFIERDEMHFHCLHTDTTVFDHRRFNEGSAEIGFHKLIYQLLVTKFGHAYAGTNTLYVYLDKRTTRASLLEFRGILNSGIAKRWDIRSYPFRRLQFQDSKSSDLFQVNDVVIGAIGYRKNGRDEAPNASKAKLALLDHMERRFSRRPICAPSYRGATRFTVWPFVYSRGVPRA